MKTEDFIELVKYTPLHILCLFLKLMTALIRPCPIMEGIKILII